jgi:putative ABC transport system permease protein
MSSQRSMWRVASRLLWRDLRAGHFYVIVGAVALAAFAIAATGLLGSRVERALLLEASRLVGGDVVLRTDQATDPSHLQRATDLGLELATTVELPTSLPTKDAQFRLVELKAVGENFPLRGELKVRTSTGIQRNPQLLPGQAWLAERLQQDLQLQLGASLKLGQADLKVAGWIVQEPDASMDYFGIAPRVMIRLDALPQTGLLQPGARATWRMLAVETTAAGGAAATFIRATRPLLKRGERLETVRNTQAEVRVGYERGSAFLRLSLLVTLLLSGAALALSAWRYYQRQLDQFAVLRAIGVQRAQLTILLVGKLLLLASLGAAIGLVFAMLSDQLLVVALQRWWSIQLPTPSWLAIGQGGLAALLLLLGFAWPSFARLRDVPALRVLQRSDSDLRLSSKALVAQIVWPILVISVLTIWLAQSYKLGVIVLVGVLLALLMYALVARLLLALLQSWRQKSRGALRFAIAALTRRPSASTLQILALATGTSALLLLAMLRTDLLAQWRADLPADTPNRFLINVQDQQVAPVRTLLQNAGLAKVTLWPMVRARFVGLNDQAVNYQSYQAGRARRLAEREFNLSVSAQLPANNRIVAGRWWAIETNEAELSAEVDFAKSLNWQLGDRIEFDIGGLPVKAVLTNLREVRWESFQPNFFVVLTPAALKGQSASWIASFRLTDNQRALGAELVARFPNVSLLDLDAIIAQVRNIVDQVGRAVELLFWFTLCAGLLVLWAAIDATQDERAHEAAVMRVIGASAKQLSFAHITEFLLLGTCAGLLAAISATGLTAAIAYWIFDFGFVPNWWLCALGILLTTGMVSLMGWLGTRRVRQTTPVESLRRISVS